MKCPRSPSLVAFVLCAPILVSCVSDQDAQGTQCTAFLCVDGEVEQPLSMSQQQFASLPRSSLSVIDEGGSAQTYEGVTLADVLLAAKIKLREELRGKDVSKYAMAVGEDDFVAVFSLPEFDNGRFLVADKLNGAAIPSPSGPLQIISPDEERRSRWVKDLDRVTIGVGSP